MAKVPAKRRVSKSAKTAGVKAAASKVKAKTSINFARSVRGK
jgi:hypothetical protein